MTLGEYITVIVSTVGGSTVLLVGLGFLFRTWISERLKGAVKHEYDQKLAEFRAELEVLNRISQERWHMKRDVFVRALRLIDSWWSNIDWSNVEPDRQDKPDIQEIRMVHNQLSLICESREVMGAFEKCLRGSKPGQLQDLSMDAIADLRSAMRKELKFTEEIPVDREFSWVAKITMKE